MNSKLRCAVVAGIYTWPIRGLNDPIKGNKVICYLKDHKILHFIRILSMHKVKALMGEPDSPFIPFIRRTRELALLCNKALHSRVTCCSTSQIPRGGCCWAGLCKMLVSSSNSAQALNPPFQNQLNGFTIFWDRLSQVAEWGDPEVWKGGRKKKTQFLVFLGYNRFQFRLNKKLKALNYIQMRKLVEIGTLNYPQKQRDNPEQQSTQYNMCQHLECMVDIFASLVMYFLGCYQSQPVYPLHTI